MSQHILINRKRHFCKRGEQSRKIPLMKFNFQLDLLEQLDHSKSARQAVQHTVEAYACLFRSSISIKTVAQCCKKVPLLTTIIIRTTMKINSNNSKKYCYKYPLFPNMCTISSKSILGFRLAFLGPRQDFALKGVMSCWTLGRGHPNQGPLKGRL